MPQLLYSANFWQTKTLANYWWFAKFYHINSNNVLHKESKQAEKNLQKLYLLKISDDKSLKFSSAKNSRYTVDIIIMVLV